MSRNLPNWIQAYLAYTYDSESPEIFHQWCAISTIAGALRRSTWFDMGYFSLYPNMYIVLISPPGRCKKSTAMRIAKGPLSQVPLVHLGVDSTSRERLIVDLSASLTDGQSPMTAHSSEFATMLTTSGMDMVVFLTDIYDSPEEWTHRTKSGGTSKIKSPCFNLLAGTTPNWLSRAMPLDTVGIGLTSRILLIYSDEPRIRDPFPTLSPEQDKLKDLLIKDLNLIATLSGQYRLSPEAREFYNKWHKEVRPSETHNAPPMLAGYYERKQMHMLKLAMVLTASKSDELILHQDIIEAALEMLDSIEEPMSHVFAGVGRNTLAADYDAVKDYIFDSPEGVKRSEVIDHFKFNMRRDELDEVLETLVVIGDITLLPGGIYKKL